MEIPRYIAAVRYLDRYSPDGFLRAGGMAAIEQEAADQAIRDEREAWLPILERWLKEAVTNNEHPLMCAILESQIRRLRRLLHLPPARTDTGAGAALSPAPEADRSSRGYGALMSEEQPAITPSSSAACLPISA